MQTASGASAPAEDLQLRIGNRRFARAEVVMSGHPEVDSIYTGDREWYLTKRDDWRLDVRFGPGSSRSARASTTRTPTSGCTARGELHVTVGPPAGPRKSS